MRRGASAAALLGLACLLLLLALDVRTIRDGMGRADRRFEHGSGDVRGWSTDGRLPFGLSRRLLAVGDDVSFRRAVRLYRAAATSAPDLDNGLTRGRNRAAAEVELADVQSSDGDLRRASIAANLLGVLSFTDSVPRATNAPAPVERSLAEFQAAVRLDPRNENAKFNLELLLLELRATGVRPGQSSGLGDAPSGHRGAGSSPPGRGY